MLVRTGGGSVGTVGGGLTERKVQRAAAELDPGSPGRLRRFALDSDCAGEDKPVCGGQITIALVPVSGPQQLAPYEQALAALRQGEPAHVSLVVEDEGQPREYRLHLEVPPTLLVVGAGHVGQAVARLAAELDFHVVVLDDRADLLTPERFPAGAELRPGDVVERLRDTTIDGSCYVVIATRGHRYDHDALAAVIDRPAAYLGMIASKRKAALIRRALTAAGARAEHVARVHTPIGLPIGAVTVPEIAVSILAEVIQVRRQRVRKLVEGPLVPRTAQGDAARAPKPGQFNG